MTFYIQISSAEKSWNFSLCLLITHQLLIGACKPEEVISSVEMQTINHIVRFVYRSNLISSTLKALQKHRKTKG